MATWQPWHLAALGISLFCFPLAYFSFSEGIRYRRTAAKQARDTQEFLSRAVRAHALVVGSEEGAEKLNLGKYYRVYRDSYPVVQLRTWQGQPVKTRVEVGVEGNPPALGQQVEVCYDSIQPQRARLNGPGIYPPRMARRSFSGCLMLVYGGICVAGGIIGVLVAFLVAD